jgi:two-component system, NtrC family, nitrogen regulation sensor histidine kinase NtrY
VIRTCAETIRNAVETVRTLVDEFSVLARFPASRPQPASLNQSGGNGAAHLFNGRWRAFACAPNWRTICRK